MKIVEPSVELLWITDVTDGICKVDGCSRIVHVKKSQLCSRHYDQMRHTGKTSRLLINDPNEFVFYDDVCKIILRNKKNENIAEAIIDIDDYERVKKYKWHYSKGYAVSRDVGFIHRFLLDCHCIVDHKNRDGLDNRKENLRISNNSLNAANSKKGSDNTSGFKGVSWFKNAKLWRASITVNSNFISIGYYKTKEDAAMAYDNAAIKYFGEHAATNKELGLL